MQKAFVLLAILGSAVEARRLQCASGVWCSPVDMPVTPRQLPLLAISPATAPASVTPSAVLIGELIDSGNVNAVAKALAAAESAAMSAAISKAFAQAITFAEKPVVVGDELAATLAAALARAVGLNANSTTAVIASSGMLESDASQALAAAFAHGFSQGSEAQTTALATVLARAISAAGCPALQPILFQARDLAAASATAFAAALALQPASVSCLHYTLPQTQPVIPTLAQLNVTGVVAPLSAPQLNFTGVSAPLPESASQSPLPTLAFSPFPAAPQATPFTVKPEFAGRRLLQA